ncbi:MAG: hypothetical protein WC055_02095 [Melioribacteraceae bacterium]
METQGFNLSTVKNSGGRTAKEGVEYITVTDGNGGDIKIMNIENEMYAPREGIIEIIPLKIAKGMGNAIRHQNEVTFRCVRDKATGWLIGIPMPGYRGKDKSIEFERFIIRGAEFLDLSIPKERLKWICIKYGPFLKGSPNFQTQSKTVYEAVDKEKQATEFFKNRKSKRKAGEIAESLHGEELLGMAMALGIDPKLYSTTQLEMEVIKFAENPEKVNGKTGAERFLDVYNSDSKVELITLKRGLSTGILTENLNAGINFNGLTLGHSEQEAVGYLKAHPSTLTSIDIQSRKIQDSSTQAFDTKPPVIKDEKDAIIERQRKEMEEMKARLAQVNEEALEAKSDAIIANEDPELAELISEAKRLLIKSPHLIGRNDTMDVRKQKLKEKIAETNRQANN